MINKEKAITCISGIIYHVIIFLIGIETDNKFIKACTNCLIKPKKKT